MTRASRPQRAAAHCLARAGLLRAGCWRTFLALLLACRVGPNAPRPGLILMLQVRTEGDFSLSVDSSDQVSRYFSAHSTCASRQMQQLAGCPRQPDALVRPCSSAPDACCYLWVPVQLCAVPAPGLYSRARCRRLACTAVRCAGAWLVQLCALPAPGLYSCARCRRLACTAVRSAGACTPAWSAWRAFSLQWLLHGSAAGVGAGPEPGVWALQSHQEGESQLGYLASPIGMRLASKRCMLQAPPVRLPLSALRTSAR